MALFGMGDLHLSFSCDKPMDIFKGWDNYAERIEKNWNAVVTTEDTVVIPGDISWAMSLDEAVSDFSFINSLNGKKIILKGNHDYWWNTMSKMTAFLKSNNFDTIDILHNNAFLYKDIALAGTRGWFFEDDNEPDKKVLLRETARLEASIKEAEKLSDEVYVFLHYPPVSETQRCEEILDVLEKHKIKHCYFGHLHGFVPLNNMNLSYKGTEFTLISADKINFCPKLLYK